MRTTLDIEDDVLQVAKEMAQRDGIPIGQIVSVLARRGLAQRREGLSLYRGGVSLLPSRGEVITPEKVQTIKDAEGT